MACPVVRVSFYMFAIIASKYFTHASQAPEVCESQAKEAEQPITTEEIDELSLLQTAGKGKVQKRQSRPKEAIQKANATEKERDQAKGGCNIGDFSCNIEVGIAAIDGRMCAPWAVEPCRDHGRARARQIILDIQNSLANLPDCNNRGDGIVKQALDVICAIGEGVNWWHGQVCAVCHDVCSRNEPTPRCGTGPDPDQNAALNCLPQCR